MNLPNEAPRWRAYPVTQDGAVVGYRVEHDTVRLTRNGALRTMQLYPKAEADALCEKRNREGFSA